MQVPSYNLAAHWLSIVNVTGNYSHVRLTQLDEVLVESHPQVRLVASSKLLQSEAVVNDEHYVGFVKH